MNFAPTLVDILAPGTLPVSALVAADWAGANGQGRLTQRAHSFAVLLLVGVLARSLASWGIHWAMRNVPVLCRVHRVHPTDAHIGVSATVRMHPIEIPLTAPVMVAVVALLGIPPRVVILYELFYLAMAVCGHAELRLPAWLDRAPRSSPITPNLHRIHCSTRVPGTNSNLGATFSFWGRLFGSCREKREAGLRAMPLELSETQQARASSFLWLATLRFRPTRLGPRGARQRESRETQDQCARPKSRSAGRSWKSAAPSTS